MAVQHRRKWVPFLVAALVVAVVALGGGVARAQETVWLHQFGTSRIEFAHGVAAAPQSGGLYVVGDTNGGIAGPAPSDNAPQVFLRRYAAGGAEMWTRQFGSGEGDNGLALGVADDGNVYIAGLTNGTLPGQTAGGYGDAFVRKYDPSGNELWTRQFGTDQTDIGYALAVGPTGVVVAGASGGSFTGQAGDIDAFVRLYDPDGVEMWTREFGTSERDEAHAVAMDAAGDVIVSGFVTGALQGQAYGGKADAFVRKYDPAGNEQWTREVGSSEHDHSFAAAVDETGDIYIAGDADGPLPGMTSGGSVGSFVRKYSPDGVELWTRQFGVAPIDSALSVAVDRAHSVYIGGEFSATPGAQTSGDLDAFVRKYDAGGNEAWRLTLRSDQDDGIGGVAVPDTATLYVAGWTLGQNP